MAYHCVVLLPSHPSSRLVVPSPGVSTAGFTWSIPTYRSPRILSFSDMVRPLPSLNKQQRQNLLYGPHRIMATYLLVGCQESRGEKAHYFFRSFVDEAALLLNNNNNNYYYYYYSEQ